MKNKKVGRYSHKRECFLKKGHWIKEKKETIRAKEQIKYFLNYGK